MPERLTAQQAFEQMMRDQVAPALRELGFRGSFRSFRYARGHRFAVLAARKSRHSNRHEVDFQLLLTGGPVIEWNLHSFMPGQPSGFGWTVRAGEPTGPVAGAVTDAVRRYGRPAARAITDDDAPVPDGGWPRAFPDPGAAGDETAGDAEEEDHGVDLAGEVPVTGQRVVARLLRGLEHDPIPQYRCLIAARFLAPLAADPAIRTSLAAAAAGDPDARVRWAARYALLLDPEA
jgi:hypothetical protein